MFSKLNTFWQDLYVYVLQKYFTGNLFLRDIIKL